MKVAFTNFFAFVIVSVILINFEVEEVSAKGGSVGAYNIHNDGTGHMPSPKGMAGSKLPTPKMPIMAHRMHKRRIGSDVQPSVLVKRHAHNAGGTPP